MKKSNEFGRSMIELIAVLTVIAILLISILLGFKNMLSYVRCKDTVKEIASIGMRYKVGSLGRKYDQPRTKIRMKNVFPEGNCITDTECTTPDGGTVELYAYNTTTFAVIAHDLQYVSCEEALLQEGTYTIAVKHDVSVDFDAIVNGSGDLCTVNDFKEGNNDCNISDFCDEGGYVSFIYSGSDNCLNFYDGECHDCPRGEVQDPTGQCCASLDCGYCDGCPHDKVCKEPERDACVECNVDTDCSPDGSRVCVGHKCRNCRPSEPCTSGMVHGYCDPTGEGCYTCGGSDAPLHEEKSVVTLGVPNLECACKGTVESGHVCKDALGECPCAQSGYTCQEDPNNHVFKCLPKKAKNCTTAADCGDPALQCCNGMCIDRNVPCPQTCPPPDDCPVCVNGHLGTEPCPASKICPPTPCELDADCGAGKVCCKKNPGDECGKCCDEHKCQRDGECGGCTINSCPPSQKCCEKTQMCCPEDSECLSTWPYCSVSNCPPGEYPCLGMCCPCGPTGACASKGGSNTTTPWGRCLAPTRGCGCLSNDDCEQGYFCSY